MKSTTICHSPPIEQDNYNSPISQISYDARLLSLNPTEIRKRLFSIGPQTPQRADLISKPDISHISSPGLQINNESPISIEFDSNIPISEDIGTPICLNSSSIRQNLFTKETLSQPPDIHELEKQKKCLCKCGSDSHSRTTFSQCILNKKNIQTLTKEQLDLLLNAHRERIKQKRGNNNNNQKQSKIDKYFEIAKKVSNMTYFFCFYLFINFE